jgi:hypothetical protein
MISPDWTNQFNNNPIEPLLKSNHPAISYLVKRDLLEESVEEISRIWELAEVRKIIKKQRSEGYRRSNPANIKKHPAQNYHLLETYRNTNILINMYGLNREHSCIGKAVKFLFSCQTEEGDIRGMIGEHMLLYYNGIKDHPRVTEALKWFIDNQLPTGLWRHSYSKIHKYVENAKTRELQLWISLAILQMFKTFATVTRERL